jgi:prefoldin subunit 5
MSNQKKELTQRIEAKKKLLQAHLSQLKADTTGAVNDEKDKVQDQIEKLDNFSESVAKKLNKWLQ